MEKEYHEVLLRTAKYEEKAKQEVWAIKKKTAQMEYDMAKTQKETMEAEKFMTLVKRNTAIAQYNQATGNNLPLPPLPELN